MFTVDSWLFELLVGCFPCAFWVVWLVLALDVWLFDCLGRFTMGLGAYYVIACLRLFDLVVLICCLFTCLGLWLLFASVLLPLLSD